MVTIILISRYDVFILSHADLTVAVLYIFKTGGRTLKEATHFYREVIGLLTTESEEWFNFFEWSTSK